MFGDQEVPSTSSPLPERGQQLQPLKDEHQGFDNVKSFAGFFLTLCSMVVLAYVVYGCSSSFVNAFCHLGLLCVLDHV